MQPIFTAHRQHPRQFAEMSYVYPVLSRRSGGISIGVNLNPDKRCNFDCIYCQVDRTTEPVTKRFDLGVAETELVTLLDAVQSGTLASHPQFAGVPRELLVLRDVALSGDGEPTTSPVFSEAVAMVVRHKPADVKLVLITDAGGLGRPDVKRGLELMDAHNGEVWAKLDAGTEAYYKTIDRSAIPFAKILRNITDCAQQRPIAVQSLFLKLYGHAPSAAEIGAYTDRLAEIIAAGGQIKQVQVCTVARKPMATINGSPAFEAVTALSASELDRIAETVRHRLGVPTDVFAG